MALSATITLADGTSSNYFIVKEINVFAVDGTLTNAQGNKAIEVI